MPDNVPHVPDSDPTPAVRAALRHCRLARRCRCAGAPRAPRHAGPLRSEWRRGASLWAATPLRLARVVAGSFPRPDCRAIDQAVFSVSLETYIYADDEVGTAVSDALIRAAGAWRGRAPGRGWLRRRRHAGRARRALARWRRGLKIFRPLRRSSLAQGATCAGGAPDSWR
ncbi:hypothetical protein ACU4GD_28920 [Cupriavidus basilensis]